MCTKIFRCVPMKRISFLLLPAFTILGIHGQGSTVDDMYCPFEQDPEREIPYSGNTCFYRSTPIGPFYDVIADVRADEYIQQSQELQVRLKQRQMTRQEQISNLYKGDASIHDYDYEKIVKQPIQEGGGKFETIADWFLYSKGIPVSYLIICTLTLPILLAGFIQMLIELCRKRTAKIKRRTWEFPLVPVLMLQQTRREYFLRKKTIRRFCIQWEVGRINIRMNTKLVDLQQILHPPKKQKKVHRYSTWRIIRLIVRFNAFLAMREAAQHRSEEQMVALQKQRMQTWKKKIAASRYLTQAKNYDDEEGQKDGQKDG